MEIAPGVVRAKYTISDHVDGSAVWNGVSNDTQTYLDKIIGVYKLIRARQNLRSIKLAVDGLLGVEGYPNQFFMVSATYERNGESALPVVHNATFSDSDRDVPKDLVLRAKNYFKELDREKPHAA